MRMRLLLILLLVTSSDLKEGKKIVVNKPNTHKANFRDSYTHVRKWEGNYANIPEDLGGITYGGITRLYNPNWYGWRYVRADTLKQNDLIPKAEFWVLDYYLDIWVKQELYDINDQELANATLDMINHGPWGRILMDRALKRCSQPTGNLIADLNKAPKYLFLAYLREERIKFYRRVVAKRPDQKIFLEGWINRAYDI